MISSTVPHWLSPSLPNAPRDGADGGQPDHKHVEFTPLLGAEQRQQRNEDTPQHRVFQNFQSNLHRRYRSSLNFDFGDYLPSAFDAIRAHPNPGEDPGVGLPELVGLLGGEHVQP